MYKTWKLRHLAKLRLRLAPLFVAVWLLAFARLRVFDVQVTASTFSNLFGPRKHLEVLQKHPDSKICCSDRRQLLLAGAGALGSLTSVDEAGASREGGERVTLNNGMSFPKASFGLQIYDDNTAQSLTELALSLGYRNFFASVLAGNQKGFARGVAASGIKREDLFICGSVVSNKANGFEEAYLATKRGCENNMKAFGVGGIEYVDMIMLDYPANDCESIRGQWKAFEEMLAMGATRSLAVSNFSPDQLDCILSDKSATAPAVNQLPFSVSSHDLKELRENKRRGVLVQAWSPLGGRSMGWPSLGVTAGSACESIAKKYGKTAAQVALRWIVQNGATFTTQTKSKDHFIEDLDIFDFQLSESEMQELNDVSSSAGAQFDGIMKVAAPVAGAVVVAEAAGQVIAPLAREVYVKTQVRK